MAEEPRGPGRRPLDLLLALTAVLFVLAASRLAQTLLLDGLHRERILETAGQALQRLSEAPAAAGAEAVRHAVGADLRSFLTVRPLDSEAHFLSYRLARLEGRRVDAELALFRCSLARPADSRIAYTRGLFLLEHGRFAEGLAFFSQSLRLDGKHLEAIYHDCMSIFTRRYDSFKYIFPEKPDIRERLASLLRHDLLLEESIEEYRWCVDRSPDSARLQFELSLAYRGNGETGSALAAVEEALRLEPDNKEYACDRGEYLLQLGLTAEAIEVCRALVAAKPNDKDAYVLWARCHEQQGEIWEAIRIYREALWRVREKGVVHQQIGDLYLKMERYREALTEYQAGLQVAVSDYSRKFALYRLGACYEKMGLAERALESLIEADAIHPEFKDLDPLVAEALQRLTVLDRPEARSFESTGAGVATRDE
jgi:tetratricopeptide (TPR) repeat protein